MIEPPALEVACGMEVYATQSPRCPGRIKAVADDFRVEEVIKQGAISKERLPGYLPLYRVQKEGVDAFQLEADLASAIKGRVVFAGIKDRRSSSVQYFTPASSRAEAPTELKGRGYTATLEGFMPGPFTRSLVSSNRFRIVVRGHCGELEGRLHEVGKLAAEGGAPNFFGLQRFGGADGLTHRVGRALVKRQFEGAVELLLAEPRASDDESARNAREVASSGDYSGAAEMIPRAQGFERRAARHLARRPGDWVGALRAIPIRLRRFYVHAYQSYLFNRGLSAALAKGLDISKYEAGDNWGEVSSDGFVLKKVHGVRDVLMPGAAPLMQLPGYAYRDYGSRFDECIGRAMAADEVDRRDFYVQDMQEVSNEGGFRRVHMTVEGFAWEGSEEGTAVNFTLAKGEYATVLLREALKPSDPVACGFG